MKPAKSTLPATDIDAPDLVCLHINRAWLEILATALSRFEWPVSWKPGTDITRAEQQIFKFYEILRTADENCCEDVCLDFPPSESFIEYFPQNPFTEPDLIPDGYNGAPFYVADSVVFTDILRVSANPFDWPAIISSGLPRIRVNVSGAVKVGLGLVSIPAGGIIFITKDDDLSTARWYELTSLGLIDVVAIVAAIPALITALFSGDPTPEEIYNDEIIEVFFDTPGDHHIDISFVPRVSPETIIGFGGGLRKVEICGQQRPTMEFRTNPEDSCQLQYRNGAAAEWALMFDYGACMTNNCCDDLPAQFRFNGAGELERSTDGGSTWDAAPGYDPRRTATLLPATGDNECASAAHVRHQLKAMADQLGADVAAWSGVGGLLAAAAAVLIFIGGTALSGGVLAPLLLGLVTSVLIGGRAAFVAAMTETVWDKFECIIFCNIQPDGTFLDGDITAIKGAINAQITGVAAKYLSDNVNLLGAAGLTNMARSGGGTAGECDDCGCGCDPMLWTIYNGAEDYGTVLEYGSNYLIAELMFAPTTVGEYFLRMKTDSPSNCCVITHVEELTGSLNIAGWSDCGTVQDGTVDHSGWDTSFETAPTNEFVLGSAEPTTVKVYFA